MDLNCLIPVSPKTHVHAITVVAWNFWISPSNIKYSYSVRSTSTVQYQGTELVVEFDVLVRVNQIETGVVNSERAVLVQSDIRVID